MRISVITPPASEPITLAEAKDYLRLSGSAHDATLGLLIPAVRRYAELFARRAFVKHTIEVAYEGWPSGGLNESVTGQLRRELSWGVAGSGSGDWRPRPAIESVKLPRPPVQSVASVVYTDPAGQVVTLDPSAYRLSKGEPATLSPTPGASWPAVEPGNPEAVVIRLVVGYGDPADVPESFKVGMLMWLAFVFENRGEMTADPPQAAATMLDMEDFGSYA